MEARVGFPDRCSADPNGSVTRCVKAPVTPADDLRASMTSVRRRTLVAGGSLALAAGLLADQGSVLGADLPHTALLGAALGAVVGLVPDRTVAGRTGAFLTGFASAWVG